MEIGPEPKWTEEKANVCKTSPDRCELKYPSAGIAMSFLSDDKKGVDLEALGVKYLRVTAKTKGPIRMAVLNEITNENDAKGVENAGAGSEPGTYVDPTEDYTAVTYDMTPDQFGFKGDGKNDFDKLDWVSNNAPTGAEIIKRVTGLKWEVKDAKGGFGSISIKAVEFLDKDKNVIDPVKITGIKIPDPQCSTEPTSSSSVTNPNSSGSLAIGFMGAASSAKVIASGKQVQVLGAKVGSDYAVFSMQGRLVASGKVNCSAQTIAVPNKGSFLVRVEGKVHAVTVK